MGGDWVLKMKVMTMYGSNTIKTWYDMVEYLRCSNSVLIEKIVPERQKIAAMSSCQYKPTFTPAKRNPSMEARPCTNLKIPKAEAGFSLHSSASIAVTWSMLRTKLKHKTVDTILNKNQSGYSSFGWGLKDSKLRRETQMKYITYLTILAAWSCQVGLPMAGNSSTIVITPWSYESICTTKWKEYDEYVN